MSKKSFLKKNTLADYIIIVVMLFLCLVTLYPLYYVIINSLNDPVDALKGGIYLWPRKFSLKNYEYFFADAEIVKAFFVTVARTVLGTLTSVLFTAMVAYPLSKKNLVYKKLWMFFLIVPMYFSGGLVPYYLLIMNLGLKGNFLVFIIPTLFSAFNCILFMNHFRSLPVALEESAMLDGANDLVIFVKIILPLSGAILATVGLFNAVGHWQAWLDAMLYGDGKFETVQGILVRIMTSTESSSSSMGNMAGIGMDQVTSEGIKLTAMVFTAVPIAVVYPFLQKYFVKGITIGSVKG
ncbi:MAG: carbohydrate ABC transporter permease [Acutalibacteraceae bacterium]